MSNGRPRTVCFPFIGDFIGGSHLSALGLIRNLPKPLFAPLVVLHDTEGPVAELFRREGIDFEPAPVLNRLERAGARNGTAALNVARTLPALVRYLRGRDVAIVHTNDGRAHLMWGLAARLAGSKHLWHHRGDATSFGLRRIAPWLPNRLVAVSKFASPRPGFISAAAKCSVVHSPFDVMKAKEVEREDSRRNIIATIGCAPETRLLGYVGTLVDRKRPILFVEVLAALRRLEPSLEFAGLFLGNALNGLDDAARSRAQALGVGDRVHFMGFRYPGEPWIAGLDALLVTAVNEPLRKNARRSNAARNAGHCSRFGWQSRGRRGRRNGHARSPGGSGRIRKSLPKTVRRLRLSGAHRGNGAQPSTRPLQHRAPRARNHGGLRRPAAHGRH
ncbi:glycosyltransferase involved in cell wall biosynthesis [Sinorhizobium fredii]